MVDGWFGLCCLLVCLYLGRALMFLSVSCWAGLTWFNGLVVCFAVLVLVVCWDDCCVLVAGLF